MNSPVDRSGRHRGRRRVAGAALRLASLGVVGALTLLLAACGADDSPAPASTPATAAAGSSASATVADPAPGAPEAYLVVSDVPEEHLYVFAMPSGDLIATLDHIELAAHTGVVVLPDGRLLFVDGHDDVLRVLDLLADGGPALVGSAPISPSQAWSAVDPDLRYYAGSARTETEAIVDLVDLETLETAQLRLEISESGETHIALGGDPVSAFVWTAGVLYSYPVADVFAGSAEPVAMLETGPGAHSQVLDAGRSALLTSLPDELHGVRIEGNEFGETFGLPWDVDGREGGRAGRLRLSYDGRYTYGSLAASVPAEGWVDRVNDIHVADLQAGTSKRMELAPGIVGRSGLSEKYAFFYSIHPDGDEAILLDVEEGSATFQQVVARISLEPLMNGPVPGESASGKNLRGGSITPDGRWAFVSHGGEGRISVIDTEQRQVTASLSVPTALAGGGYLVAWQPGAPLVDLLGR